MALVEPVKKGGRYTIKEQEERKIQVYHLHFEENKSAVKIAELLGISRNTINADVVYWHSQLANEINSQDLTAKMIKQIQRIEIHRDRLLEFLNDVETSEKFKIEKFISNIDNNLLQYYSKMIKNGNKNLGPTVSSKQIDESELKELVRVIIFSDNLRKTYPENELKFHLMHKTKCDVKYLQHLFEKMKLCGLELCKKKVEKSISHGTSTIYSYPYEYDLLKFANLRGYVSESELSKIIKK